MIMILIKKDLRSITTLCVANVFSEGKLSSPLILISLYL